MSEEERKRRANHVCVIGVLPEGHPAFDQVLIPMKPIRIPPRVHPVPPAAARGAAEQERQDGEKE